MKRLLTVLVALMLVSGVGLMTTSAGPSAMDRWLGEATGWFQTQATVRDPSRFITKAVERGDISQTVLATGTLHALVTVDVSSQLSGQISELFVDFNDSVSAEQPIARLDQRSFEARLSEAIAATRMAKAEVGRRKAKLERARIDVSNAEGELSVMEARVESARLQLEAAERQLARTEQLGDSNAVSVSQVEDVRTVRDTAAVALREAQAVADTQQSEISGSRADLETAKAELESAEANLAQKRAQQRSAEIDLERTVIRSPVDGIVVGRDVDEGQTVAASLEAPTLFTIAGDLERMQIHARVDEADVGQIQVGQTASFTVDAYPERRFSAVVESIRKAPRVLQSVVTYTVVLATSNPEKALLPGMTAVVRIAIREREDVLKIPMAALRFAPQHDAVPPTPESSGSGSGRPAVIWRVSPSGDIKPVTIETGIDDGTDAALVEGKIEEGDLVAVSEVAPEGERKLFGIRFGF